LTIMFKGQEKIHHQDTKRTKGHQGKAFLSFCIPGETLCAWFLGGSQFLVD